jgi:crotonobetainyl-CoA:carnitine CoA-transferase CaiB-like acyl-CoA transferase
VTGYRLMAACLPAGAAAAGCSVLTWARSGLMELTGCPAGPPLAPAAPVLARVTAALSAVRGFHGDEHGDEHRDEHGDEHRVPESDLHAVLASRAAEAGWRRRGTVSANGSCRLLPAADGWVAVNLARPVDVDSLPAVLGRDVTGDPWDELRSDAAGRPSADLAAAAQLVGIPAAVLGGDRPAPVQRSQLGARLGRPAPPGLVLDLSAMWAGPLCASILGRAGWRVLKVEDSRRPDGARSGPPAFYARLHAGQASIRLDFGTAAGRAELRRLAGKAAIVIESSRRRALRGLGLIAEDWIGAAPGRSWVSITGYGRDDPRQRVAFGDDAAVAGGLVAYSPDGTPVFCGDAIADPLTGLYAALAALTAHAAGGGELIDVAMAGVSAHVARPPAGRLLPHLVRPDRGGWTVSHGALTELVRAP